MSIIRHSIPCRKSVCGLTLVCAPCSISAEAKKSYSLPIEAVIRNRIKIRPDGVFIFPHYPRLNRCVKPDLDLAGAPKVTNGRTSPNDPVTQSLVDRRTLEMHPLDYQYGLTRKAKVQSEHIASVFHFWASEEQQKLP